MCFSQTTAWFVWRVRMHCTMATFQTIKTMNSIVSIWIIEFEIETSNHIHTHARTLCNIFTVLYVPRNGDGNELTEIVSIIWWTKRRRRQWWRRRRKIRNAIRLSNWILWLRSNRILLMGKSYLDFMVAITISRSNVFSLTATTMSAFSVRRMLFPWNWRNNSIPMT